MGKKSQSTKNATRAPIDKEKDDRTSQKHADQNATHDIDVVSDHLPYLTLKVA